jgi:sugar-specific transcriptional regulator TrmB
MKCSTAGEVSRYAQVARQDIYRILTELHRLGLVEKVISTLTRFAAIPIQNVVAALLERRIKETCELQERTKELIQRVNNKAKTTIPQENPHFVLIPEKEALAHRIKKAIENSRKSIDLITSSEALPQILFVLGEKYKEAMRRGVKIRYIVHTSDDGNSWSEILADFSKNHSFQLVTLSDPPETRCGIYDKKEVVIATFPSRGAFQSPALLSNNHSLIAAIQDHFEKKWIQATENNGESHT